MDGKASVRAAGSVAAGVCMAATVFLTACAHKDPPVDPETGQPIARFATFAKSFGDAHENTATVAIPTEDGGYAFAGEWGGTPDDRGEIDSREAWLGKLDANGDEEWQVLLGTGVAGEDPNEDCPTFYCGVRLLSPLVRTPDGGYIVGGRVFDPVTGSDFYVAKLDASGMQEWARRYDSGSWLDYSFVRNDLEEPAFFASENRLPVANDNVVAIAPRADGGYWIVGKSTANVRTPRLQFDTDADDTRADEDEVSIDDEYSNAGGYVFYGAESTVVLNLDSNGQLVGRHRYTEDQFDQGGGGPFRDAYPFIAAASDGTALLIRMLDDQEGHAILFDRVGANGESLKSAVHRPAEGVKASGVADALQTDDNAIVLPVHDGVHDDGFAILFYDYLVKLTRDFDVEWTYRPPGKPPSDHYSLAEVCDPSPGACFFLLGFSQRFVGGLEVVSEFGELLAVKPLDGLLQTVAALEEDGQDLVALGKDPSDPTAWRLVRFAHTRADVAFRSLIEFPRPDGDFVQLYPHGSFVVSEIDDNGWSVYTAYTPEAAIEKRLDLVPDDDISGVHVRGLVEVARNSFVIAATTGLVARDAAQTAWLVRVTDGRIDWQRAYVPDVDDPFFRSVSIGGIVTSGEGGVVVSLAAHGLDDGAHRLIKFGADGEPVWQTGPLASTHPGADALVAGSDGYTVLGTTASDNILSRVDADGDILWERRLHLVDDRDPFPAFAWLAAVDDRDGRADAGYLLLRALAGGRFANVVRLDADARVLWSRDLEIPAGEVFGPRGLAPRPGGGAIIGATGKLQAPAAAGARRSPGNDDLALLELDTDGSLLWTRLYGGLYGELLGSVRATADGGVLIASRSDSMGERSEGWIVRTGLDGAVSDACNADLGPFADARASAGLDVAPIDLALSHSPAEALPALVDTSVVAQRVQMTAARQCLGSTSAASPGPSVQMFRLTVTETGLERGVVTSTPQGILCGTGAGDAFCSTLFAAGTRITLATDSGSFSGWYDACEDGTGLGKRQCTVTMDRDRGVTVEFARTPPGPFELAVAVQGGGLVSGDGIFCRVASPAPDCAREFAGGADAHLIAAPDAGWTFVGWSGGCAQFGAQTAITVRIGTHLQCFAQFAVAEGPGALLAVAVIGQGTVRDDTGTAIDCREGGATDACAELYPDTRTVSLTAAPDAGRAFSGWGGDCASFGTEHIARVVTVRDQTCTAAFAAPSAPGNQLLTVQVVNGSVDALVQSTPAGILCSAAAGSDCGEAYAPGTEVLLRATPAAKFAGWQGCDVVIDVNGCRLTLNAARTVTANFNP